MSAQSTQSYRLAERLAKCMATRRKFYKQQLELGEEQITMHVDEFWEAHEEAALKAFEDHALMLSGAQPLPLEM